MAQSFQRNIFCDKYDIDDFCENGSWTFFGHEQQKEGLINYTYLSNVDTIASLYTIIRSCILNNTNNISPNDITILGYTANHLRLFDCYYRYASREHTRTMLETIEAMYMRHLNYFAKDLNNADNWFKNISNYLSKKMFPKRNELFENDIIKLRQHIAKLLTIYDLYSSFPNTFNNRLKEECEACGISIEAFCAFVKHYNIELCPFKTKVYNSNYKTIRDNKKFHFWMNSGTIKISTINSFKGWESEVIFLIIEPQNEKTTYFNLSFDELLYTGLTRCKRNLFIVNFGNEEYDQKMRPLIEHLK